MRNAKRAAKASFLLGLIGLFLGCVVVPAEGYYDRDHHRYYHEREWHECGDHDGHCGRSESQR
ncbi:MAG TPA: hypothetical protein VNY80_05130 [Steroidobacteraceae bacterium]|jgi:hypothetical protein|nr:hypothetical protein [Steroidobacteraceae bacterium]